ncbi:hypothetical protein DUNSADRAFT_16506 [Dunaliella salina]|uniref:Uncharacterized protein n=1 Tax=Dunaliella salina TaxID=3046 RepID=A0ABQ7G3F9_DUNSA|nr:hypothetical protein DUNSADRAFT_16506 [Dunaliella salina]|eukprot:KAF5829135.1 hypothetical protein DUNSADRAFT_16506 [Dunaliella salina]
MCITSSSSVANTGRRRRPNGIWTRIMQPMEAASCIFGEREVDIYGMSLSWQSKRVLMNIVCEQFARLFCGQRISIYSPIP